MFLKKLYAVKFTTRLAVEKLNVDNLGRILVETIHDIHVHVSITDTLKNYCYANLLKLFINGNKNDPHPIAHDRNSIV